jgi:hypothetical protein
VAHNYVDLDLFVIFYIIKNNIRGLKDDFMRIISLEIASKNFDIEELKVAETSFYYRHINFKKF